jgi:hypothetical protein
VYSIVTWYILRPFGNLLSILSIFPGFGILCQEKSGNPDTHGLTRKLAKWCTNMIDKETRKEGHLRHSSVGSKG